MARSPPYREFALGAPFVKVASTHKDELFSETGSTNRVFYIDVIKKQHLPDHYVKKT